MRRRATAFLAMSLLAFVTACDDGGDAPSAVGEATSTAIIAGPVAAIDLVVGDCIEGLVIGAAERARIESARIVGCDDTHELEVFATFALDPSDFPSTEAGIYPGQQRVVTAADEGCASRLAELGLEDDRFGLIALWPTDQSWTDGDRGVSCAAFPSDGMPFEGRQILADQP